MSLCLKFSREGGKNFQERESTTFLRNLSHTKLPFWWRCIASWVVHSAQPRNSKYTRSIYMILYSNSLTSNACFQCYPHSFLNFDVFGRLCSSHEQLERYLNQPFNFPLNGEGQIKLSLLFLRRVKWRSTDCLTKVTLTLSPGLPSAAAANFCKKASSITFLDFHFRNEKKEKKPFPVIIW